jgi:hypothetical protein
VYPLQWRPMTWIVLTAAVTACLLGRPRHVLAAAGVVAVLALQSALRSGRAAERGKSEKASATNESVDAAGLG